MGGHGFLGKNLQGVFNDDKYDVEFVSRRTDFDLLNLTKVIAKLSEKKYNVIVMAAAHVGSIGYVNKNSATVVYENSQMYLNLYEGIRLSKQKATVINLISNCSYPGIIDIQNEEDWWDGPIHESVESYGTPKKLGFIISECYKKQYGIYTVNLIMPNAYGPNDYVDEERTHAMNGIIMRMIKAQNTNDKEFVVWGTGSPVREWIYMPDMAKFIRMIIDKDLLDGIPNPINIGQENGISIIDSVEVVAEALGYKGAIVKDTTKQDGAPIKVLGKKLFEEEFDFQFTTYKKGIEETIKYYKEKIN